MKLSFTKVLAVVVLCCAASAMAGPDTFQLGTGRDGALLVTEGMRTINTHARVMAPLAPGDVSIQVDLSEGLAAGDLVMVLQTTGMVPLALVGNRLPVDLGTDAVGRWELVRLAGVEGDTLRLTEHLIHPYAADVTQVIRVPEYTTVDIRPGASIVAKPWDGAKGGVIAFLATGTITNEGRIDASGMGFRGGIYVRQSGDCAVPEALAARGSRRGEGVDSTDYGHGVGRGNVANGGGGGACLPSGGGGGGNAGPGGQGGQPSGGARDIGGMGGTRLLYSLVDHLTLGGGGGGGSGRSAQLEPGSNGGRGGGAIFIRGGALAGRGSISASGESGAGSDVEGAGGGGAGGSISVRFAGSMSCESIRATGGMGGNDTLSAISAPGGGGGGGRVLYQATSVGSCAVVVEAGLAGPASDGGSHDAQPAPAHEDSLSGLVTRLPGGFISLGQASVLWPAHGSTVTTRTPTIVGAAPAGMEVVVYVDGWEAGRAVSEGGLYLLALGSPLVAGVHHVQAATVFQGVQSEKSPLHTFSVERGASRGSLDEVMMAPSPDAPVVLSLALKTAENGMYISTGHNVDIIGTAEVSSTVNVIVTKTDGTRSSFVTTTSGVLGTLGNGWSVRVPNPDLVEGSYTLVVTATNGNGTSPATGLLFWVDFEAPVAPEVSFVAGKAAAAGMRINQVRPIIQGTAEAGTSVVVTLTLSSPSGTTPLATVADVNGKWSVQPSSDLAVTGTYTVSVMSKDAAGRSTSGTGTNPSFTVDMTAPNLPVVTLVDGKGPATNLTIKSTSPTIQGTAEAGSTVTVSVTKDGTTTTKTKLVTLGTAATGWSVTFDGAQVLSAGDFSLAVTATDGAGNTSPPTGLRFKVDPTAPAAPTVSFVAGKTAAAGMRINQVRPIIQGTAEAGSSVTVTLTLSSPAGTTPLVTVADANGKWSVQPTSDLAETGSYTVSVTSMDAAGWSTPSVTANNPSFTVDTGAPNPPVVTKVDGKGPATNLTIKNTIPTIEGTAEAGSTVMVSVTKDGTTTPKTKLVTLGTAVTAWSVIFDGADVLSAGDFSLAVTATDAAGNTSPPTGLRFTVDPDAPLEPAVTSVAGTTGSGLQINDANPILHGTAEPGSSVTVTLTSIAETQTLPTVADESGKWSVQPPSSNPLTDGDYTVSVTSTDAAGNPTTAATAASFTLDTTVPDTTILPTGLPRPLDSETVANFTFSSSETVVTYECNVDGAAIFSPCSGPGAAHTIDPVLEGPHTLLVRARDLAGNVDDTPASYSWRKVGADAFIVNIVGSPRPVTNDRTATFKFTSTRLDVEYECQRESDSSFSFCRPDAHTANTVTYTDVADGSHSLEVRGKDGDTRSGSEIFYWVVDTQSPSEATINEPAAGIRLNTRRPVIRGTVPALPATDRVGEVITVQVTINGESSPRLPVLGSERAWSYAIPTDLGEGEQTLYVQVRDDADNTTGFIERKFVIDFTPPDTSTTGGPPSDTPTRETGFSFGFSSNETVALYECRLDNEDFGPCTNPYTGTVTHGPHVMQVRARDIAGNIDLTPARYTWTVDTQAPNTAVASGPSAYVNSRDVSFVFSATEEGVTFECALDVEGDAFEVCPSSATEDGAWSFLGLAEKSHTLRVRTRDQAGNVDATPATHIWNVDLTAPARPEIASPEEQAVLKSRASLLKGTAEANGTVTVYVNGAKAGDAPVDEEGNWSLTVEFETSTGTYELMARTADRAGNPSELTAPRTILLDVGVPSQVIGGGLSCTSTGGAEPFLASLGWMGLLALSASKRRREGREKDTVRRVDE